MLFCVDEWWWWWWWSTKCNIDTVVSPDDGHVVAQNMYRKAVNVLRKIVQQVGFISHIIQGRTVNKTNLLTRSMVQSPSWAANWFAASQEIPRISQNLTVHYRTHNRPSPVSILGQPNPIHFQIAVLLYSCAKCTIFRDLSYDPWWPWTSDIRQQYEGYMNHLPAPPVWRQRRYLRKSCVAALTRDKVPRSSRDVATGVLSDPVMAVRKHESAKDCIIYKL